MRVTVIPASKLTPEQIQIWSCLQQADPALDSPFFCPQFTHAVSAVRRDVEVAVMHRDGQTLGFFPFQRIGGGGKPAGAPFSEFHGVVASPRLCWTPEQLLAACGLSCWSYDHLPLSQKQFAPYHREQGESPCMDLDGGFEAYCERKRSEGSTVISQAGRKARKLAREVGPLRFELHCAEPRLMESLVAWKTAQHQRTRVLDVFQFPWVHELLQTIRDTQTEDFCGMMSVLYAGDQAVAVHLGVRTPRVAHIWYPAYDVRFAKYSPGVTLLVELARELAQRGIRRIDFGPGPQRYKQSFQTGAIRLAVGTVDRRPAARLVRRGWDEARTWLRNTPLAGSARGPARALFRMRQWLALR